MKGILNEQRERGKAFGCHTLYEVALNNVSVRIDFNIIRFLDVQIHIMSCPLSIEHSKREERPFCCFTSRCKQSSQWQTDRQSTYMFHTCFYLQLCEFCAVRVCLKFIVGTDQFFYHLMAIPAFICTVLFEWLSDQPNLPSHFQMSA